MNTVSSSTSYSSASNKGLSGLASGINTEEMVEKMLSGTQAKIDKQKGVKQQTLWKQEMYRSIITSMNKLQSKFFDYTSSTNLLSVGFFNAMSAASSSNAVKVTGTSAASAGSTSIKVGQLATKTNTKSASTVSGDLSGTLATSANVTFEVKNGENWESVSVDVLGKNAEGIRDAINTKLTDLGIADTKVKASVEDGKLKIGGTSELRLSSSSSKLGASILGLSRGVAGVSDSGETPKFTLTSTVNTEVSVDVVLDGITKAVKFSTLGDATARKTSLEDGLKKAFGGAITVAETGGKITLEAGQGRQIYVGGSQEGLDALGMVSGQSNKISTGLKLKEISFGTKLQGGQYAFEINGEQFTFSGEDTLSSVLNKINASDAGVRISYSALDDKFSIEAKDSGKGFEIEMKQESGNLLNAMFGGKLGKNDLAAGSSVVSNVLTKTSIAGDTRGFEISEGSFKINVDGKDYTIALPRENNKTYNRTSAISYLNEQLASRFGDKIKIGDDGKLAVAKGTVVTFSESTVTADSDASSEEAIRNANSTDLAYALGFSKIVGGGSTNNKADENATLAELGFGTDDTKISELKGLPGVSFDAATGRLTVSDQDTLTDNDIQAILGDGITLGTGAEAVVNNGKNAIVEINGVLTERSSNAFTVDGLNIDLSGIGELETEHVTDAKGKIVLGTITEKDTDGNDVTKYIVAKEEIKSTITTTRSTDSIVSGIKSFVEEYNKLIEELNDLVREEATYKKYPPLTDAQRKEMSESEIKNWETEAKKGLLRGDATVSTFLSSMRSALYTKPEGAKYALYDIGIETSGNWRDNGKLILDETKLKKMLDTDPAEVEKLFNDATGGVANKVNDILNRTAKTNTGSQGSLVTLAGAAGRASDTQNTLSKQIKDIDTRIEALKTKYEKERSKYWSQFNAMEKAISNMNSQSAWLAQYLSA